ncbi:MULTISPECIES: hypothetical protein [unclassified Burkholderia]|uniref:hypothetical protein n=1 Tax=unclassified Burkholderia TaxID=2613784 RepID=UPI002ABE93A5|nr:MULTISPECIES: hypothetical protein [unclassified Burkholderia]
MKSDRDLAINFDEWLRLRLAELQLTAQNGRALAGDEGRELAIAIRAVQIYAERHPRPLQVTQRQAAEMLGLSKNTVCKMVRTGHLRLNRCGMVPIEQVDRALAGD